VNSEHRVGADDVEPTDLAQPELRRLIATLLERCTFPEDGETASCAVSGGADSLALMVLAHESGCRVTAHHVHHAIRPDSDNDVHVVTAAAETLGIDVVVHRVVVEPGANLESRARAARHAALPRDALFGHTADDQAETILGQLLRGAGPVGLAGMAAERHPILNLRRTETEKLCRQLGLQVVQDPSNADPRFRRNRIRHEVLPLLNDVAARDVVPLLVRAGRHQRQVVELLDAASGSLDATDAVAVSSAEPAVGAMALRRWWRLVTGSPYAPDERACLRMMKVARGEAIACDVHDGWRLVRHQQVLELVRPSPSDEGRGHLR